jgi:ribosomal protein L31E
LEKATTKHSTLEDFLSEGSKDKNQLEDVLRKETVSDVGSLNIEARIASTELSQEQSSPFGYLASYNSKIPRAPKQVPDGTKTSNLLVKKVMIDGLLTQVKPVIPKNGVAIAGFYKKMSKDACHTYVILKQENSQFIMLSFPKGSMEEKIIHSSLLNVKHNIRIRIKKTDNAQIPLEVQKRPKSKTDYAFIRNMALIKGQEIFGVYRELQKDFDNINLILELPRSKLAKFSFPKTSLEAEIIKSTISKVKHKVKLRITKTDDDKRPIALSTILDTSTKGNSLYIDKTRLRIVEQYSDPSIPNRKKRWLEAISTMDEIIENKQFVVAVIVGKKVQCNKMQKIEANRFFCAFYGAMYGTGFCLEKCQVAKEFQKITERVGISA